MELESQKHTLGSNRGKNIEIPTRCWNCSNTHSDETKQETLKFQRGVGISETHIRRKKNKKAKSREADVKVERKKKICKFLHLKQQRFNHVKTIRKKGDVISLQNKRCTQEKVNQIYFITKFLWCFT